MIKKIKELITTYDLGGVLSSDVIIRKVYDGIDHYQLTFKKSIPDDICLPISEHVIKEGTYFMDDKIRPPKFSESFSYVQELQKSFLDHMDKNQIK